MSTERTVTRLVEGLSKFPAWQVMNTFGGVVKVLKFRGMSDEAAHDRAYSGMMAHGSVCLAVGKPCPGVCDVLSVIDSGNEIVKQREVQP